MTLNESEQKQNLTISNPISVAPMMDWTDRHCRYFHRLLHPNARLYTEMITTGALIHGDRDRFLRYSSQEHPLALQLGGNNPDDLATCAKMAEDLGYDEVNLNCGCPSDRVQSGAFGACLMNTPDVVTKACTAMLKTVDIPVTVKCRIGVDECNEEPFLDEFVKTVSGSGVKHFIIHARKAWLKGLSPKENRDIPPLQYDVVERLKDRYPNLVIEINGGITDIELAHKLDQKFDGIMIGREAYQNPRFLADLGEFEVNESAIIAEMMQYAEKENRDCETPVKSIYRHMLGLFKDRPGAKLWRQYLSQNMHKDNADTKVILKAYEQMQNVTGRNSGKAA